MAIPGCGVRVLTDKDSGMRFHFPIVIIDEDFRSENTSGSGIRELAAAMEAEGMSAVAVVGNPLAQFLGIKRGLGA